MKLFAAMSAGLLFGVVGVATVVHSQEPKPAEGNPAPHPQAHPGAVAPAPHPQAHPETPAPPPHKEGAPPHPQAQPPAHPPAAVSHEQRPAEAHPPVKNAQAAHPAQDRDHHEAVTSKHEAHPPVPPKAATAPKPSAAARPQTTARPAAEPARTAEARRPAPTPEQERDWDRHRADNWQAEHHNWQERGGYRGYRIPEQRYQAYFGPPHVFRIYEYPVAFYNGYPRFQYGNYWVQVVDPWPNYFAPNWFYTDPVYVAYLNDGYYLVDTLYPNAPIAVEIFG